MIVSNGDVNDGVGSDWSMMRRDMSDKLGESSCLVSQKGLAGTDDCDRAHRWVGLGQSRNALARDLVDTVPDRLNHSS